MPRLPWPGALLLLLASCTRPAGVGVRVDPGFRHDGPTRISGPWTEAEAEGVHTLQPDEPDEPQGRITFSYTNGFSSLEVVMAPQADGTLKVTTGSFSDLRWIDENGDPIVRPESPPRGKVVIDTLAWAQADEVHCKFDLHWGSTWLAGGGAVVIEHR